MLGSLAIAAVTVAGCSSAATVDDAGAASPSMTGSSPSAVPTTSSATATTSPIPSVDLENPVGIIAIGHSGLTGEGTGATSQPVYANSWATGTDPEVDSEYLRMTAALPETEGHVANTAVGGAPASTLSSQAKAALGKVPAPALAIIQTVDNDIQCDAANVADVGAAVADVLALIHDASPNTKILVVGQLGRPSVSFVEDLVAHDPAAKAGLTWPTSARSSTLQGPCTRRASRSSLQAIDAYEAETARVCAAVPNCAHRRWGASRMDRQDRPVLPRLCPLEQAGSGGGSGADVAGRRTAARRVNGSSRAGRIRPGREQVTRRLVATYKPLLERG